MASTTAKVRALERSQVAPQPRTVAVSIVPLTYSDISWLFLNPIERILFFDFPHPTSRFLESFVPNMKSSLSLTLHRFYSLAGKIRLSPEQDDRYEIHYVEGDSVPFTAAEHAEGELFDELSGSRPRAVDDFLPLLPDMPESAGARPLLAVQVTVFQNHGVSVGIKLNHAACDGFGSTNFISSWASACRSGGSELGRPPVLDRTLMSDPRGLYSVYVKAMRNRKRIPKAASEKSIPKDHLLIAPFTLEVDSIQRLKDLVRAQGDNSTYVSSIVVTYAYTWVCVAKARRYAADTTIHFVFSGNYRSSLKPPLPESYFGNCIAAWFVSLKAGDLLDEEDGFVTAAKAVGQAIKGFKEDPLRDVEKILNKFMSISPEQTLIVSGSPKFRVYDFDFGWGRPKQSDITSIRHSSSMSVQDSRGGGVEVGLVLPKDEMDDFIKHFSSRIKILCP